MRLNVVDRWPVVIGTWVVTLAALVAWLRATPEATLRQQLSALQFWWLEATVWAVVALGAFAAYRFGRDLQIRDLRVMGALAARALGVTLLVAPSTNRIYYDEQIYQGIGQNLSDMRRAHRLLYSSPCCPETSSAPAALAPGVTRCRGP